MSKIIVPQELQEKIIDLYVNKLYTRKKIKEELNLSFGDSVIKRILVENNIDIRTNPGAQKGGRKKQEINKDIQQKIIKLYSKGYGLEKIVKELNLPFGFDKVRSILQDNNIHIRNVQESAKVKEMPDLRKYQINDDYEFESHNGAWILGFIAADGYLPLGNGSQNRVVITLARQDEDILELIKKELQYTGPLYQYISSNGFPNSSLSFTSKKIRQKIESYGIGNNKTFKLKTIPKNLPEEFVIDFIRGYFDGDGSLYEPQGKKINMSFTCASYSFIKSIRDYLCFKYNLTKNKIYKTVRVHEVFDIKYYVKDSLTLGKLFYNNDFLALPRKKKHFFNILKKYNIKI